MYYSALTIYELVIPYGFKARLNALKLTYLNPEPLETSGA